MSQLRLQYWLLAALFWLAPVAGFAREPLSGQEQPGLSVVAVTALPAEAQQTLQAIKHNGPFSYDRDGAVFGNYERLLPSHPRGYYHEYTVKTPGRQDRGARRIVCGIVMDCFYTADHYQSFKRILEQ